MTTTESPCVLDPTTMTEEQLCSIIDHTLLKPDAQRPAFETLCREAAEHNFAMVAINSVQSALCRELLGSSPVRVGAAIGFPLGQTTTAVKEYETVQAIADGAGGIDYVIDIGRAKAGDLDAIGEEMTKIVAICRREGVLSKVIFENCYLDQEEIRSLCGVAAAVRPDFIKTSTGFGPSGATAADVALMKLAVGPEVKVKAAGGIRSWETCQQMLLAGAERIGTSSGLTILAEFRQARAAAQ